MITVSVASALFFILYLIADGCIYSRILYVYSVYNVLNKSHTVLPRSYRVRKYSGENHHVNICFLQDSLVTSDAVTDG